MSRLLAGALVVLSLASCGGDDELAATTEDAARWNVTLYG